MNTLKLSIGIPVYNEEKNIIKLLDQLKSQIMDNNVELVEVLVYCDGSLDRTPQLVKAYKWEKLKITWFPERKGKIIRLQQLFSEYAGEILVLVDADIKLKSIHTIQALADEFIKDPHVKLVGGYSKAAKPKSFIQKAFYTSFLTFDYYRQALRNGNNIYNCTGACVALHRDLITNMKFPKMFINEDDFMYLTCVKQNFRFQFAKRAVVFYKLPADLADYWRTRIRSNHQIVRTDFHKYFGSLVDKETKIPLSLYIISALRVFIFNPFAFISALIINQSISLALPFIMQHYRLSWYSAKSTK